jgi:hypothetical protein
MNHIQPLFDSHPRRTTMGRFANHAQLVEATMACAQACITCADACMAEANVQQLVRCIRTNLDCAGICTTTTDMLSRMNEPDWRLVRAQLQACLTACEVCAEECTKHANMHAHCKICAETCRNCANACRTAMGKIPEAAAA